MQPPSCISNKSKPGICYQLFAALIVNIIAITDGITLGWTAPLIPYFISEESHIPMTLEEAEWMESWLLFGAITGLPVTMYSVSKFGRKKGVLFSCCTLVLCWLTVALADRVEFIYAARFVMGLGLNMAYVAMPMYIGEISHKNCRGLLSSLTFIYMLMGVLIIYCVGPYFSYYVPPILSICLLVLEFIVFLFIPESPYFLLVSGKEEEAKKSLSKFRGGTNIDDEFKELVDTYEISKNEKGRIHDLLLVKHYRRSAFIMFALNMAQLLSSYEIMLMNLHNILSAAGSNFLSPSLVAIVFSAVTLIAAISAALLIDGFGRKKLMIVSSILTSICLLSIAVFFHLQSLEYNIESINWLPMAAVMCYAAAFKFGLGIIPIVITAEIFAPKMRAIGMTLADGAYVVSSVATLQLYFFLRDMYGMHVPFYIFAICTFLAAPFVLLFIPETKGKTLDEIQTILKKPSCFMIK